MHREDKKVTTRRVSKLVESFIQSEIESLRPEVGSKNGSFFNLQCLYTTHSHSIIRRIKNSKKTKFILKSEQGDAELSILMGRPDDTNIKQITITIKNNEICYKQI